MPDFNKHIIQLFDILIIVYQNWFQTLSVCSLWFYTALYSIQYPHYMSIPSIDLCHISIDLCPISQVFKHCTLKLFEIPADTYGNKYKKILCGSLLPKSVKVNTCMHVYGLNCKQLSDKVSHLPLQYYQLFFLWLCFIFSDYRFSNFDQQLLIFR